jgi:hypothetical protein
VANGAFDGVCSEQMNYHGRRRNPPRLLGKAHHHGRHYMTFCKAPVVSLLFDELFSEPFVSIQAIGIKSAKKDSKNL